MPDANKALAYLRFRVALLDIRMWRGFDNVSFSPDHDDNVICLVGDNGTGKSNILELLSAVCHRIGMTEGIEMARGNPFDEYHDFVLELQITDSPRQFLEASGLQGLADSEEQWGGILRVSSKRDGSKHAEEVIAPGKYTHHDPKGFANTVINVIKGLPDIHYLYLDADRSYPPIEVHPNQYAQALRTDWRGRKWKKQRSFKASRSLYDDWLQHFLAVEAQANARFVEQARECQRTGAELPTLEDPLSDYSNSVERVLPHLHYRGIDPTQRQLLFDSSGVRMPFKNLSGGEREVAFLVGQVTRFYLRRGLLLIDEPELHLNPELQRHWLLYLRDSIDDGQVWLATHSLEAVEVAGPDSTFVLERGEGSRRVTQIYPLTDRPVVSVLARALGAPAYSLSGRQFLIVEGDRHDVQRDRYHELLDNDPTVRVIEGGGCNEVVRLFELAQALMAESDGQLHIGAVVDRDLFGGWRQIESSCGSEIHVLSCHEIENVFLEPKTLVHLMRQNGIRCESPDQILREEADAMAGCWIAQYISYRIARDVTGQRVFMKQIRKAAWSDIEPDVEAWVSNVLQHCSETPGSSHDTISRRLLCACQGYSRIREGEEFWKYCCGKEMLARVARCAGFRKSKILEQAAIAYWRERKSYPEPVNKLRQYIASL